MTALLRTRCYAQRDVSVSVCLSLVGVLRNCLNGTSCVMAWKVKNFLSPVVHSGISRLLSSGTLSENLDLESFARVSRSCCQQNWLAVELVDTYDSRHIVAGRT